MLYRARLSRFIRHPSYFILALLVAGCAATATAAPSAAPSAAPTSASDNPTAGANRRSTQQAATSQAADRLTQTAAAATKAAVLQLAAATQTAGALQSTQAAASATAAARATGQAISATAQTWPQRLSETFADNHLGWPVGPSGGPNLAVTATVAGGRYHWFTTVAELSDQGTYTNLVPAQGPAVADFAASVSVTFAQANADSQSAFGLVFRQSDQGFGFFGVTSSGQMLVAQSHNPPPDQNGFERSAAFDRRPGAANRLSVVGLGSNIVCLINGQVVAQMSLDLAPGRGQIGLGVEALSAPDAAQADFSDLEIRGP